MLFNFFHFAFTCKKESARSFRIRGQAFAIKIRTEKILEPDFINAYKH